MYNGATILTHAFKIYLSSFGVHLNFYGLNFESVFTLFEVITTRSILLEERK